MNNYRTITLEIAVELPEHCILTSDQPSKLTWELLAPGSGHLLDKGTPGFQVLYPAMQLYIPNAAVRAGLELWIYYCAEADMLCMLERRSIKVDDLNASAIDGVVTLPVRITGIGEA